MTNETVEFKLPPVEGPEGYYGVGFLDDLISDRIAGATAADLIDRLCLADLCPIIKEPARHLPYYVHLLTADESTAQTIGEGARTYDRFNERALQEILVGSSLEANVEAQRTLRIAFAMNAHGVLVECLKGEDPALLLQASRLLRRSLFRQLINEASSPQFEPGAAATHLGSPEDVSSTRSESTQRDSDG
jgi:hypothetical protein